MRQEPVEFCSYASALPVCGANTSPYSCVLPRRLASFTLSALWISAWVPAFSTVSAFTQSGTKAVFESHQAPTMSGFEAGPAYICSL